MRWLDALPWTLLLVAALFLGLAPLTPEPHLIEKARLLIQGRLQRILDVVDLFYHSLPLLLLLAKAVRALLLRRRRR
jgi:hypothetical protein